jgi:hypothetical protein
VNIPSSRQLKLARFKRKDFRSTTPRGKHAQGWTWERAMCRLRSWLTRARRNTVNDILAAVQPLSSALRALRAHHPVWNRTPKSASFTAAQSGWYQISAGVSFTQATPRQPGPLRRFVRQVGRRSAPVRRHRLEDVSSLPHAAYLTALDARARYVTANLLKLKGLAEGGRLLGETSWKEARHADRYATA